MQSRCHGRSDLIASFQGNRQYIPVIYVLNKIDQISIEELDIIYKIPHAVPISAHHKWNFDDLLAKMWEYLNLKRIYTKPKGQLPDYEQPVCRCRCRGAGAAPCPSPAATSRLPAPPRGRGCI